MQDLLLLQPLQNRTATLDAESDDYTDSPSDDPKYSDGKPAAQKRRKNCLRCLNLWDQGLSNGKGAEA